MGYRNFVNRRISLFIYAYILVVLFLCSCAFGGSIKMFSRKVEQGVTLEGKDMSNLTKQEVEQEIIRQANNKNKEVVNASINPENWDVIPEVAGYKVDVQKTVNAVMSATAGQNVMIIATQLSPNVTAQMLTNIVAIIGESSTPILDDGENRVNNIELSISAVNGKILNPGEQFSFNGTVGQRTESKGYEKAPIIVGKHKEMAPGGGVCQLSTTLFNAAESAGLNIIERHTHSKSIGYVPRGDDATISYGSKDLKFINNRQSPIMIRAKKEGDKVHAWIIEKRN